MEPGLGQDNYYTLIFSNVRLLKRLCSFLSLLLSFFFFFSFSIKFISWFWVGRSVRWEAKKPLKKSFTKKKERKKERKHKKSENRRHYTSRVKFLFSSSEEIRGPTGHVSENDQSAGRCWLQNGKSARNCDSVHSKLFGSEQGVKRKQNIHFHSVTFITYEQSLMNNSIIVCYLG